MTGSPDGPVDGATLGETEIDILVTAIRRAAGSRSGAALDDSLAEIGWSDALASAPRAAVGALFEAQGAACSTSGALGQLLLTTLGVADVSDADAAVVLPAFGSAVPPATGDTDATEVRVRGLGLAGLGGADTAVLLRTAPDGSLSWATAPVAKLSPRAVQGLDGESGLFEVDTQLDLAGSGWAPLAADWADAVALARLAVGHELVGTMRTMLELARQHALERVQFDRPIAGFQAVRHRLAEALVAVEGSSAALDGAWSDRSPTTAALAKAACGHGAVTVRRHCQQVLAGIGFTTEHDLHRYVRRSVLLDGLFGSARSITAELGAQVLAQRELPRVLPL